MIYLNLFWTFFKIGLFTFGGGYAMIPLIQDSVVGSGWISEDVFLDFLAISESTPGPVSINMATFIGAEMGGVLGSVLASIGVILPSFIIMLLISIALKKILNYSSVRAVINGIKPVVIALIFGAAITLGMSILFGIKNINSTIAFDYLGLIILLMVAIITFVHYKIRKKSISPILLILFSAVMGIVFYGI